MSKKSALIHSIICFTIAGILLYFLTGCGPKRIEIQGWCRHEALYVGAALNEKYPGMVGIEWSHSGDSRFDYHAQAFAKLKGNKKTYFTRWNNMVVKSERDEQSGEFYKDQTVYEFFMSQYHWWRY
jgi:hypothetical protein